MANFRFSRSIGFIMYLSAQGETKTKLKEEVSFSMRNHHFHLGTPFALGPSSARLGGVLGRPGCALGTSWGVLGASWAVFPASWRELPRVREGKSRRRPREACVEWEIRRNTSLVEWELTRRCVVSVRPWAPPGTRQGSLGLAFGRQGTSRSPRNGSQRTTGRPKIS